MLRVNKIKQKMKNGETVKMAQLRFANPSMAEIMVLAGVEYITIDNAHYPFDMETIQHIIRTVQGRGAFCGVRIPGIDHSYIGQLLDMGADGIHVPTVETYEEACDIVNAVKYAPIGKRGFCPITRGAAYGFGMSFAEYAQWANANTIIGIQVETKKGIENCEKIASVMEIDSIGNGPSDLAVSYGVPGQNDHPLVKEAIARLEKAIAATGRKYATLGGYCSSDQQILMAEFEAQIKDIRKKYSK